VLWGPPAKHVQVPEMFYLPEVLIDDSEMDSEDSETNMVPGMANSFLIL
jgi:hypothetical protein